MYILNKDKNENVYIYYGSIPTYFYYSMIYNLPKDIYIAKYPDSEKDSEIFLQNDLENLPNGIYYILFVIGTGTYKKDINYIEPWLKSKYEILSDTTLKSVKLLTVKIK